MELGELVIEALKLVSGIIKQNRVNVVLAANPPKVFGNRKRLLEVLLNLIDNVAKFVARERRPQIEISFEETPDQLICHVQNNGEGIEPRYQDKVSGLSERLHPDSEGSGIGLALATRIIVNLPHRYHDQTGFFRQSVAAT